MLSNMSLYTGSLIPVDRYMSVFDITFNKGLFGLSLDQSFVTSWWMFVGHTIVPAFNRGWKNDQW